MIRGLYTAAAGMVTQQRRHDTATQNIANLNTTGYKQVNTVTHAFPDVLISAMSGGTAKQVGRLNTGVFAEQAVSQYLQGDLIESGKSFDFALSDDLRLPDPATGADMLFDGSGKHVSEDGEVTYKPQAFFTVQDNEGNNLYTRNGSFTVNASGEVLSSGGFRVLDAAGNPLVLTEPMDNLAVDGQGNLLDPATGLPSGAKIGISIVTRPQELVRDGNGVFHADDADAAEIRFAEDGDNLLLRQGYIEGSNVDATQVTVDMNAAYRAYEANQKVVQIYDTSLQKAVNEVGRV
ncbi:MULTISPECIES: flagellar hook-basal body protein [unclassified Paenibacillus]|uniref:flagellar hook-basal body protein n=1 Tax=unclassified Paenibacillus TaxID=185978 RepID=UPI002404FEBA|nr:MULTISPECIES: flagellar hook-basal body protein [unclassified Paenibacillus]MDF9840110.1 flagellar basal-body rod protein FlgF [Paenibacillus sp. PastF-2]MDF9846692.1 flagellar basal-body rod protein FlgF [Paenibacillus sp. PastM-2]MDF9852959.1 flagellar basal-body rod protein FlgF [Paenibacillus sp. PastF-1]MDH6478536.1 flagellar basal-body rod protein FlgF [Paenibacillus sp. PastH-2]MDH6505966.1 flagellar basal-body rod protein FlgF [Paenibacillus sp. PastM-3]